MGAESDAWQDEPLRTDMVILLPRSDGEKKFSKVL